VRRSFDLILLADEVRLSKGFQVTKNLFGLPASHWRKWPAVFEGGFDYDYNHGNSGW